MEKNFNINKKWFSTLKEAKEMQKHLWEITYVHYGIFRRKYGVHKGEYFVGSHVDFINR